MARKEKPLANTPVLNLNEEQMAEDMQKVNELARLNHEASENAHAVARQLGYDGALTVGALEDEIRFYQRRTIEACLELGKRLLILKELTLHGEFAQRVELLGISDRMAQKFMSATLKFSNANSSSLLRSAQTQSKLLELVVLDDGEIEALEKGETVRGLRLDDIETMSVRELKAALREERQNYDAQGKRLGEVREELDKTKQELYVKETRSQTLPPDEIAKELRSEANLFAFRAEHAILNELLPAFRALDEHSRANGGNHAEYMTGLVVQIELAVARIREDFGLDKNHPDSDLTPVFMRPESEAILKQAEEDMARRKAEWAAGKE